MMMMIMMMMMVMRIMMMIKICRLKNYLVTIASLLELNLITVDSFVWC